MSALFPPQLSVPLRFAVGLTGPGRERHAQVRGRPDSSQPGLGVLSANRSACMGLAVPSVGAAGLRGERRPSAFAEGMDFRGDGTARGAEFAV